MDYEPTEMGPCMRTFLPFLLALCFALAGCTDGDHDHDHHHHDGDDPHFHVAFNEDNGATMAWSDESTVGDGGSVAAGESFTLAFRANGPGSAELALWYGDRSVDDADMDGDAYEEEAGELHDADLPRTHTVTLSIDAPGTYYFRGVALDGDEGTVTTEWTITVV